MINDFLEGKITAKLPPIAQLSDIPTIIKEVGSADLVLLHATEQAKIAQIMQYLRDRIPHNDVSDAGLMVEKAPQRSKSEDTRFLWAVRVAQDPMYVLRLMQLEQLCDFDVTVMKDLYPELYQQLANELIAGVMAKFTPEQQIPRGIKKMLSIYLQVPVGNAKTLSMYKNKGKSEQVSPPSSTPNIATQEGKQ